MDLSIIIVTWNCKDDLRQCLASLARAGPPAREIIVVDNASTDGTPLVTEEFPGPVACIANRENRGFAGGNNQGIRRATGRYILLLNPDTVVHPGALQGMVGFLDEHPDAWVVGPTMLNGDGSLQRVGVHFPTLWDLFVEAVMLDRLFPQTRLFGHHRALYRNPEEPGQVDYVQGSCLMIRRSVLEQVGNLDEGYFMYFEEADLCRRVSAAGGTVWFAPVGEVVHVGSGEFGHFDERRILHYHRSLIRFFGRYHGRRSGIPLRLILLLRSGIRIALWALVYLVRPAVRTRARSSCTGYLRTLAVAFRSSP